MATIREFIRNGSALAPGNTVRDMIQNPKVCIDNNLINEGTISSPEVIASGTLNIAGGIEPGEILCPYIEEVPVTTVIDRFEYALDTVYLREMFEGEEGSRTLRTDRHMFYYPMDELVQSKRFYNRYYRSTEDLVESLNNVTSYPDRWLATGGRPDGLSRGFDFRSFFLSNFESLSNVLQSQEPWWFGAENYNWSAGAAIIESSAGNWSSSGLDNHICGAFSTGIQYGHSRNIGVIADWATGIDSGTRPPHFYVTDTDSRALNATSYATIWPGNEGPYTGTPFRNGFAFDISNIWAYDDTWHFWSVRVDRTVDQVCEVYRDGVVVYSESTVGWGGPTGAVTGNEFLIGENTSDNWRGLSDAWYISSYSVTAAEMAWLYACYNYISADVSAISDFNGTTSAPDDNINGLVAPEGDGCNVVELDTPISTGTINVGSITPAGTIDPET